MCAFSQDTPKLAPPPAPPTGVAPLLKDPFSDLTITGADGQPTRRKTGLASLRIDRPEGSTSLNIPS